MRQRLLYSLLFFFICIPVSAEDKERFTPIDLTSLTWYATEGFVDVSDQDFHKFEKAKPPLVLLDLFHKEAGDQTYKFTVVIPVTLQRNQLANPLVLQLAWVGEGWRLFANNRLQADHLFLNQDGRLQKTRTFRGVRVPIDPSALREGENLFVFHVAVRSSPVSSVANDNGGFSYAWPYWLTTPDQLQGEASEMLSLALNTVYFFFGLYHFLIFLKRRKDAYNFYFGLFSVLLAVYGFSLISYLYPHFDDTGWLTRLKYGAQPLLLPIFLFFFHSYAFADRKPTFFMQVSLAFESLLVVFFLFMPIRWMEVGLRIFYVSAAVFLAYSVYYLFVLWSSRAPGVRSLSAVVLLLIGGAVFEILDSMFFFTGIRPVKFGFFVFVMALVALLANRFLNVHNESERLNVELTHQKDAFKRFVPVQFLELLGRDSATDIRLGDSSLLHMSVLMCDLRGFTSLSEKLTPDATLRFLNEYLDRMQPAIERQDGFVDKFVGDAVLALFSDHSASSSYRERNSTADRAIQAAIEMRRQLSIFNEKRAGSDDQPVDMGIGINTGPLVLGTVGSEQRLDTTVIGNTVNLASRVEGLCRLYRAGILITEEAMNALTVAGHFNIRELDFVRVKGKEEPVRIFEVFDADVPEAREGRIRSREDFSAGLTAFRSRNFPEAIARFEACLRLFPGDRAARLHLRRSQVYAKHPPADGWDGVFEMRLKRELSV